VRRSRSSDRDLARSLLERGERTAVLTYLADCAQFWAGNEALLEGWRSGIERGEPTQLYWSDEARLLVARGANPEDIAHDE
jgi:hypothetical protein